MTKSPDILIQGNITDSEVAQLQRDFSSENIHIGKLITKGQTVQEFIQLIFQDFNVISFTRDFVISGLLTSTWLVLKKVIQKLKNKEKQIKTISCELEISNDKGDSFVFNFVSAPDDFTLLIEQVDEKITIEFLNNLTEERQIFISLDSDKKLKIEKF